MSTTAHGEASPPPAAAPSAPAPTLPPTFAEQPPRRINICGPAGSGKSTLAARLATILSLPHLELDGLFHGPGWVPRPEFVPDVEAFLRASTQGWVIDGNYRKARPLIWAPPAPSSSSPSPPPGAAVDGQADNDALPGADTAIILDLPKYTVLSSLFQRTMRRVIGGEVLWNGNTETWSNVFSTDPAQNVMAYCYTTFEEHRQRLVDAEAEGREGVRFVRLTSRAAVEEFVRELEGVATAAKAKAEAEGAPHTEDSEGSS